MELVQIANFLAVTSVFLVSIGVICIPYYLSKIHSTFLRIEDILMLAYNVQEIESGERITDSEKGE